MDPNACIRAALEAVEEGDMLEALGHARNLQWWVYTGGFPPDRELLRSFVEAVEAEERPGRRTLLRILGVIAARLNA